MVNKRYSRSFAATIICLIFLGGVLSCSDASDSDISIDSAVWKQKGKPEDSYLHVKGTAKEGSKMTLVNAKNREQVLGTVVANPNNRWGKKYRGLTSVPCQVRVEFSGGESTAELDVKDAPTDCK